MPVPSSVPAPRVVLGGDEPRGPVGGTGIGEAPRVADPNPVGRGQHHADARQGRNHCWNTPKLAARSNHGALSLVGVNGHRATAEARDLAVVHYNTDFELVPEVTGQDHQWAVPRGMQAQAVDNGTETSIVFSWATAMGWQLRCRSRP